jgi:hypothetical protein
MVMPNGRVSQPKPPPKVNPAIPVVELIPVGSASANACVSLSTSARVAPGPTDAVWVGGSTLTIFIGLRSINRPPSPTALPAMLWPPPRTATVRSCSFANRTA